MTERRKVLKSAGFGLVTGGLLSVIPWELVFVLVVVVCLLALFRVLRSPESTASTYVVGTVSALAVVVIAVLLPVKHLDRSVGPMRYETMPLDQLTHALFRDWRVFVMPDHAVATNMSLAFSTIKAMSRREVLQKLAHETGGDLRIGYCGTGATSDSRR